MPEMQTHIADHDETCFRSIACRTCHGPGAEGGVSSTPNAELSPIDFADSLVGAGAGADVMSGTVVPEMSALLGHEPFDPNRGDGFGGLGCHFAA